MSGRETVYNIRMFERPTATPSLSAATNSTDDFDDPQPADLRTELLTGSISSVCGHNVTVTHDLPDSQPRNTYLLNHNHNYAQGTPYLELNKLNLQETLVFESEMTSANKDVLCISPTKRTAQHGRDETVTERLLSPKEIRREKKRLLSASDTLISGIDDHVPAVGPVQSLLNNDELNSSGLGVNHLSLPVSQEIPNFANEEITDFFEELESGSNNNSMSCEASICHNNKNCATSDQSITFTNSLKFLNDELPTELSQNFVTNGNNLNSSNLQGNKIHSSSNHKTTSLSPRKGVKRNSEVHRNEVEHKAHENESASNEPVNISSSTGLCNNSDFDGRILKSLKISAAHQIVVNNEPKVVSHKLVGDYTVSQFNDKNNKTNLMQRKEERASLNSGKCLKTIMSIDIPYSISQQLQIPIPNVRTTASTASTAQSIVHQPKLALMTEIDSANLIPINLIKFIELLCNDMLKEKKVKPIPMKIPNTPFCPFTTTISTSAVVSLTSNTTDTTATYTSCAQTSVSNLTSTTQSSFVDVKAVIGFKNTPKKFVDSTLTTTSITKPIMVLKKDFQNKILTSDGHTQIDNIKFGGPPTSVHFLPPNMASASLPVTPSTGNSIPSSITTTTSTTLRLLPVPSTHVRVPLKHFFKTESGDIDVSTTSSTVSLCTLPSNALKAAGTTVRFPQTTTNSSSVVTAVANNLKYIVTPSPVTATILGNMLKNSGQISTISSVSTIISSALTTGQHVSTIVSPELTTGQHVIQSTISTSSLTTISMSNGSAGLRLIPASVTITSTGAFKTANLANLPLGTKINLNPSMTEALLQNVAAAHIKEEKSLQIKPEPLTSQHSSITTQMNTRLNMLNQPVNLDKKCNTPQILQLTCANPILNGEIKSFHSNKNLKTPQIVKLNNLKPFQMKLNQRANKCTSLPTSQILQLNNTKPILKAQNQRVNINSNVQIAHVFKLDKANPIKTEPNQPPTNDVDSNTLQNINNKKTIKIEQNLPINKVANFKNPKHFQLNNVKSQQMEENQAVSNKINFTTPQIFKIKNVEPLKIEQSKLSMKDNNLKTPQILKFNNAKLLQIKQNLPANKDTNLKTPYILQSCNVQPLEIGQNSPVIMNSNLKTLQVLQVPNAKLLTGQNQQANNDTKFAATQVFKLNNLKPLQIGEKTADNMNLPSRVGTRSGIKIDASALLVATCNPLMNPGIGNKTIEALPPYTLGNQQFNDIKSIPGKSAKLIKFKLPSLISIGSNNGIKSDENSATDQETLNNSVSNVNLSCVKDDSDDEVTILSPTTGNPIKRTVKPSPKSNPSLLLSAINKTANGNKIIRTNTGGLKPIVFTPERIATLQKQGLSVPSNITTTDQLAQSMAMSNVINGIKPSKFESTRTTSALAKFDFISSAPVTTPAEHSVVGPFKRIMGPLQMSQVRLSNGVNLSLSDGKRSTLNNLIPNISKLQPVIINGQKFYNVGIINKCGSTIDRSSVTAATNGASKAVILPSKTSTVNCNSQKFNLSSVRGTSIKYLPQTTSLNPCAKVATAFQNKLVSKKLLPTVLSLMSDKSALVSARMSHKSALNSSLTVIDDEEEDDVEEIPSDFNSFSKYRRMKIESRLDQKLMLNLP